MYYIRLPKIRGMTKRLCRHLILGYLYLWATAMGYAQPTANTPYQLHIQKATQKITLDGKLSEPDWQQAQVAADFQQTHPNDTAKAITKTEVRMTYDDKNLYVGAICYDPNMGNYIVQSLKRDFSYPITDAFAVFLDPVNNQTNGFSFAVSPLGVQREGLVLNGGRFGVTTSWDNKWLSKVTQEADHWVAELAIPFKTLRYDERLPIWRINFSRNNLKIPEGSAWHPVPTQLNIANLANTGELVWDQPPKKAGSNIALIPFVTTGLNRDLEATDDALKLSRPDAGLDAKIAVTSSLNLDVTINPDFSQVEVDRQVTNLDRFSIFFPERRQFFIENSDLFNFGISPMRPFFSRRIGLSGGRIIPILLGARLTGNLNENWRIGVMSLQTEGIADRGDTDDVDDDFVRDGQNYSIATVQRKLWERSSMGAFIVNRQAFQHFSWGKKDFNTVAGTEFIYRSKDGKWRSEWKYHHTFTPEKQSDGMGGMASLRHDGKHWFGFGSVEYMGENYTAEVGFTPELFHRNDEAGTTHPVSYWASLHWLGYQFYPKKASKVRFYGPEVGGKIFLTNEDQQRLDRWTYFKWFVLFNDRSVFRLLTRNYQTQLYFPTNITGRMDSLLQPDAYRYTDFGVEYEASKRNRLYGSIKTYYGGFYNAKRFSVNSDITYRAQPWGNFSLSFAYNNIDFPDGFGDAQLFLLGPKVELTFSKSVFFTTFLQYNTQIDNFNVNSRLQWRFAPMSDLFVVFTNNINTENVQRFGDINQLDQKNWGLVMKLNYWLAL